MRVWIRSDYNCTAFVNVSPNRNFISDTSRMRLCWSLVCRSWVTRLLRGSGVRLPKHGTTEIISVSLKATK